MSADLEVALVLERSFGVKTRITGVPRTGRIPHDPSHLTFHGHCDFWVFGPFESKEQQQAFVSRAKKQQYTLPETETEETRAEEREIERELESFQDTLENLTPVEKRAVIRRFKSMVSARRFLARDREVDIGWKKVPRDHFRW